jgi:hypothetical protein
MRVTKTVSVAVEVDVKLDDFESGDLLTELIDRGDGSMIPDLPIEDIPDLLGSNGCPPELVALVQQWLDGRLSVTEALGLAA